MVNDSDKILSDGIESLEKLRQACQRVKSIPLLTTIIKNSLRLDENISPEIKEKLEKEIRGTINDLSEMVIEASRKNLKLWNLNEALTKFNKR